MRARIRRFTLVGALAAWGGSLLKFTMPTLLPQATKKIKLGMPSDYPPGTVRGKVSHLYHFQSQNN